MGVRFLLALATTTMLLAGVARAEDTPVDVELVLAVDVSRSIDDDEYRLQKDGYAQALADEKVIAAIKSGPFGAIAVTYIEWSSEDEQDTVVAWHVVSDAKSAAAFAGAIAAAKRRFMSATSISGAIDYAVRLLASSGFQASRRTIDISGDGINNRGRTADAARDDAIKAGITINALAILDEPTVSPAWRKPPVDDFMREHVIGGPGAFLVVAKGFQNFSDALKDKLVLEIAGDARLMNDTAALYTGVVNAY
jgi:hypothetical protein